MTAAARLATELVALCEQAVHDGVTPGLAAVVAEGRPGGRRFAFEVGRLRYAQDSPRVHAATIYDLASLTKALSTTWLCAVAEERGALALLEAPWPAWPGVTVAHALRHDGGLVAWRPVFKAALAGRAAGRPEGARLIIRATLATPPEAAPGERVRYSDLGFMALGALLEERLGARLDHAFAREAAPALGAALAYAPIFEQGYHPAYSEVAPTEECPWRARVVQGQVHDDNAFAMGGVAGHAGLFGSARDVEAAGRVLLRAATHPEGPIEARVGAFARAPGPRGLGFDRATPDGTTGGALSPQAFGHLGFTGTSLWLDPGGPHPSGAIYVLLTNRVHPRRDSTGIRALRVAFHRLARRWLEA